MAPLLALFSVYGIFSLTTHLNIGHRHILPLYPVLIIFTGALGWAATRGGIAVRLKNLLVRPSVPALLASL